MDSDSQNITAKNNQSDDTTGEIEEIENLRNMLHQKQNELDQELKKKREQLMRIQEMKTQLQFERDNSERAFREKINQLRSLTEALVESTKLVSSLADRSPSAAIAVQALEQTNDEIHQQSIQELKLHCQMAREQIQNLNQNLEKQEQEQYSLETNETNNQEESSSEFIQPPSIPTTESVNEEVMQTTSPSSLEMLKEEPETTQ
ncbi:uncharacterized protein LOC124492417 [Dermatophagoides farinae]|uniref:uncharacterized protein LOC124492417 n=1 Tax=Dermatophagoides farinae TaxID=6954 RepID=UPI003F600A4D